MFFKSSTTRGGTSNGILKINVQIVADESRRLEELMIKAELFNSDPIKKLKL